MSTETPVKKSVLPVVSLVSGIISMICCAPLGLVAIITGILGLNAAKKGSGEGKGMAIAGIVLGAVGIVEAIILTIAYVAFGAFSGILGSF